MYLHKMTQKGIGSIVQRIGLKSRSYGKMRHICTLVWATCFGAMASTASAQSAEADTTYQLHEVVVTAPRLKHFTTGNRIEVIDSATLHTFRHQTLADLLSLHSQVFIKNYGPGSLATTSMRGAGASHTAVLWNGFNIQSPSNGQADFALLPAIVIDEVQLQYGGAGALYGSGAIGGTIHLNNNLALDKGLQSTLSLGAGSWGSYQQGLKLQWSNRRIASSIKLYRQEAANNFTFRNTTRFEAPIERQQNAQFLRWGLLQENKVKLTKKQSLDFRVWYQDNERNLPPTMTTATSTARQQDESWRLASSWQRIGSRASYFVRVGHFNDRLHYFASQASEPSITHTKNTVAEAESNVRIFNNQHINVGINNTYTQATAGGYGNLTPDQIRTSLFASYKIYSANEKWKATLNLRKEKVDNTFTPFTPSLGFEATLHRLLQIQGNVSRNYRVPTFNDLFWFSGGARGNPDLLPESGWSYELGNRATIYDGVWQLNTSLTAYSSHTKNLITWRQLTQPGGQTYWMPINNANVWSRGLEASLQAQRRMGTVLTALNAQYHFVRSTNLETDAANRHAENKQLMYVPMHTGQVQASSIYKGYRLAYIHAYTGKRFTTIDNKGFMPHFHTGNLHLSKEYAMASLRFNMSLQANNLWSHNYQVLAYTPMPLRNYQIGLTIQFN
jgi:vitamin B12 transporter